jgi:Mg-chelatase subunit ChlD
MDIKSLVSKSLLWIVTLVVVLGGVGVVQGHASPLEQEIDVVEISDRIGTWHRNTFSGYRFNRWISLGDVVRFNERIADGDLQAYIDPAFLNSIGANAAYVDCEGVACATYFNDMVLGGPPSEVPAQTLWHEGMHAIFDNHDSELLVSTDEIYTWYVESVVNVPLQQVLTAYEDELNKGEGCDQKRLDQLWDMFERRMSEARNTSYGSITDDAQLQQLRDLTGFHVDVDQIRAEYVAAGLDKCNAEATPEATAAALDLIFCIDVTGSMDDDIGSVKAAASDIVNTIASRSSDYRVAIIAYRDWDDSMGYPMFEDYGFSSDVGTIIGNINSLSVGGGDDEPEAVLEALMRAIESSAVGGWRNNVNKQVIVMGDAPPHDPSQEGYTAAIVAQAAEDADPVVIQAVVVGNAGVYSMEAADAFRELADLTGGNFFEAADASQVPEVLQRTIEDIQPLDADASMLLGAGALVIGAVCLGAVVLVGLIFLLLISRRRRRQQPAQAGYYPPPAYPAPPPPAPSYPAAPPQPLQQAPNQARYCPYCGTVLRPGGRFCSSCGRQV